MIEDIKGFFGQVKKKHVAITAISEATGAQFNTIKSHWLSDSGGWSVPKKHQQTTVETLQNVVKIQNIEVKDAEQV